MTRRSFRVFSIAVVFTASLAHAAVFPVGDGTQESCPGAALDAALEYAALDDGGTIQYACGPLQWTIPMTSQRTISGNLVIDGGEFITLSAEGSFRPFVVPVGATLTLDSLHLSDGKATGDGGCIHS